MKNTDNSATVSFPLFKELFGSYVQINDRFESVHIWSRELAFRNKGRWTPILIRKSNYEAEKLHPWRNMNLTCTLNKTTYYMRPIANTPTLPTRYFVDVRCGCAAVRDTLHPKYDQDYPGLHHDTFDVVEYRHGFQNKEKGCWEISEVDIRYLNDHCASLNNL